ncbi:hypothetical protein L6452_22541 [Arctium lappa]|uniref:Uncharacterized protein n=1 Tax=Arctium lappa TaxID=4217 RepID=A0ACB9B4F6_ARCLA|nr:hypothetical protein L6452_22541 [Arctium lappa]
MHVHGPHCTDARIRSHRPLFFIQRSTITVKSAFCHVACHVNMSIKSAKQLISAHWVFRSVLWCDRRSKNCAIRSHMMGRS